MSFSNSLKLVMPSNFLKDLQERGIEKRLEGELDAHLDYSKHNLRKDNNTRNGYSTKKIKTSYGEEQIKVPGDPDSSFNPMLIPKRKSMVEGLENIIVSLEAKGISVSDTPSFWMSVLTDMKARRTEDILITANDNLNGFTDTIQTVFPESKTQICDGTSTAKQSRISIKNRRQRVKYTKNKFSYPTDDAVMKSIYLAVKEATKK